jgi:hypothetical protein
MANKKEIGCVKEVIEEKNQNPIVMDTPPTK